MSRTDLRFVAYGSREWVEARQLRYLSFFRPFGLPEGVMDDDEEVHAAHLVASVEGVVIGYGRLYDSGNGTFHLSQLVVATNHRRRKIGTSLLKALMERVRCAGGSSVQLKARLSVVGFYQAAGFRQHGTAFPSAKTGIPHVNMTLIVRD